MDRLVAEALFTREPKVKKVKQELTFKDYVKFQKELKEFEEWQKTQKKEDKKEEPKSSWDKMSVVQKLTILTISVPIMLMLEVFLLLKFAVIIGQTVGLH
jgi:hypothetical protein